MFKKFNIMLILLLILFISISAIGAADDLDMNLTSDKGNVDTIEVSDYSEDVSIGDVELGSDVSEDNLKSDEASVDISSAEPTEVLTSTEYTVDSSNFGTYFDDKGNLKDNVKSGDTLKFSGSFSNKNMTFNKNVTVIGDSSYTMVNSLFTFTSGASGSSIYNLKISNTNAWTYGVFLNGASYCLIQGCTISSSGLSAYPICLGNGANYNNVIDNNLQTSGEAYGHGTRSTPTLVLSGSHHNYLANNNIQIHDANAIYLSSFNGGPLAGGDSNYNTIFNNTIRYLVIPTSWSYAIQIMGSRNTIDSNRIIGAYRGITTSGLFNVITGNYIINLTGADYNNKADVVGGEYGIAGSYNTTITDNYIINAKIISTGAAISAIDYSLVENNYIDVVGKGMGIKAGGFNVVVKNNNVSTDSGVGINEKDDGSGLLIDGNNISSNSAIGILIEKINSKRMPSNVTIINNVIFTENEYAIDASGVASDTGMIENNVVNGKKVRLPSGVYDDSRPTYKYNESNFITITPSNIHNYINDNGDLVGDTVDGAILNFEGKFENRVIYINKAVKIIGTNSQFINSTFKVTSGGVWIENLTISNKKAERINAWGIYVNGAVGVKIINNTISVSDPNAAYAIYILESSYVEVINNTLFSDGEFLTFTILLYSSEECTVYNNDIKTLGTGDVYTYSPENSIEGKTYYINGTEVCVDGNNNICIDGKVYCLDGNELCIDGVTYCLDGNELVIDGVAYSLENSSVTIGGVTYIINGSDLCIDGKVYCLDGNELCIDGVTYCLDGNDLVVGGVRYSVVNGSVCIDGATYYVENNTIIVNGTVHCLDGNEVDIGGKTYCLDGNELCIDGVTYCLDGNELVIKGTSFGVTSHVVPEIYRTYGILLLYSSNNNITQNHVNVTSKLNQSYPFIGNNSSKNSLVGIDIYYNSHNNILSGNEIYVQGKDNYIYGMGVKGNKDGHPAPVGQDASNNKFLGNIITLTGQYLSYGIIAGWEANGCIFDGNMINIVSDISYAIYLEQSQKSTVINNVFVQNSDYGYGLEIYASNDNVVKGNDMEINGKQIYGIVVSGNNNTIEDNIIASNGNGENSTVLNLDSLGSGNAGIILIGNSTNNNLKSNNITSQKGYAVVIQGSGNTVEDNYVVSEKGNGSAAINASTGNEVTGNYIHLIEATFSDASGIYLQEGALVLNAGSELNGAKVKFYNGEYGGLLGEATVVDGKATLKINLNMDIGSYPITAIISKENYKTSQLEAYLTVNKATLNVQVTDISVKPGLNAIYVVKITNSLGKPVSGLTVNFRYFTLASQIAFSGKTDKNGLVSIVNTFDKAFQTSDSVDVMVSVIESDYYLASNAVCKVTVLDVAPVNIKIANKLSFGSVLAKITDNNGFAVANKKVSIKIDGKSYSATSNSNGEVILPSTTAKSHTVVISSAKDDNYAAGSSTLKVNVVAPISGNTNKNVYFGNTVSYKIRIADKNGNYLGAGKVITIKVNGKSHKIKTNKNGYVTYSIKKVGTYTVTAEYNKYKVSNKIVIKPTLTAKNISKKKAKKIKFSAKLVNKNGKILKNKKITFKVKGKKYTAKTNKKGIATVSIKNLKVGKYTITSSYGGCTIKNTIKIKK